MRFKSYCEGSRQLRLVEFATAKGDPHWSDLGHIGHVLTGGLDINFNGEIVTCAAAVGIFIPPRTQNSHQEVTITRRTQLILVQDLYDTAGAESE